MSAPKNIFALVPIHNGLPHVIKCIESLKGVECQGFDLHIIVINDGSTDASEAEVHKSFPEVEILSGQGELWWTGAMDLGTRHALSRGCDFVFWVNHDDQITSTSLATLMDYVNRNPRTIGCCGVASMSNPGGQTLLGYRVHYFSRWYLESLYSSSFEASEPIQLDLNGGHGILIPAEVFSDPGNHLRPKIFPHYFGDFDFFRRVRKSGWQVYCVPGSLMLNDDSNSGILNGRRISSYKKSISYVTSRRSIANLRDRPLFALLNFPWGLNLIWMVIFWIVPIGCALVYPLLAKIRKRRGIAF